jgi:hypothetical protein
MTRGNTSGFAVGEVAEPRDVAMTRFDRMPPPVREALRAADFNWSVPAEPSLGWGRFTADCMAEDIEGMDAGARRSHRRAIEALCAGPPLISPRGTGVVDERA